MKKLIFIIVLASLLLSCAKNDGPIGPLFGTGATIFEHGGKRGAAGATIKFFKPGDTSSAPCAICTTDDKGRYSSGGLPSGEYNLLAEKDSFVLFQGPVVISPAGTTMRDDTLEPSSSLSGVVGVQYPHDPRTVTVRLAGIDKQVTITDEKGAFALAGLAAGTWSLLVQSSLTGYMPYTGTVTIAAGSHAILSDTIRLFSTDIPFVSDIWIGQDTLAGTVKLSWKKTAYKNCVDYVVFKASCSDLAFSDTPAFYTNDTFLIDSIPVMDFYGLYNYDYNTNTVDTNDSPADVDSLDAIAFRQCFRYRIAVRTWEQEIGPTKGYAQIDFAQKALVTTHFYHSVNYPLPEWDSASVGDTVMISLTAKNFTRPLRTVSWYDPVRKDTISTKVAAGSISKIIRDTVRYSFDSVGTNLLIAVVLDSAGVQWFDTVYVKIVNDAPIADAGPDTGVFIGTMVRLHGQSFDQYDTVAGWEWKIGSGAWNKNGSSDTEFIAPLSEEVLICSLAVSDKDGNRDTDEVRVFPSYPVRSVVSSLGHDLFLKADSSLWAQGGNYLGQLGDGSMEYQESPVKIMDDVKSMSAGLYHTLILKTDGSVWVCGSNDSGQLGDGISPPHPFPIRIMDNVQSVAAGRHFSLFLKKDGILWASGSNKDGQLGDGTFETRYYPVQVMTDVGSIAAGEAHSIIIKSDGTAWTVGRNRTGQLGLGNDSTLVKFTSQWRQVMADVQSIAANYNYSLFLKNDKTLWACGTNSYGQLGDGTMQARYAPIQVAINVTAMVASAGFSMTIRADQTLWACGWNYYGDWGTGTFEDRYMPAQVTSDVKGAAAGSFYALILKTDGSVWRCGPRKKILDRIFPFLERTQDGESDE